MQLKSTPPSIVDMKDYGHKLEKELQNQQRNLIVMTPNSKLNNINPLLLQLREPTCQPSQLVFELNVSNIPINVFPQTMFSKTQNLGNASNLGFIRSHHNFVHVISPTKNQVKSKCACTYPKSNLMKTKHMPRNLNPGAMKSHKLLDSSP
jgi:hypothetical protein